MTHQKNFFPNLSPKNLDIINKDSSQQPAPNSVAHLEVNIRLEDRGEEMGRNCRYFLFPPVSCDHSSPWRDMRVGELEISKVHITIEAAGGEFVTKYFSLG